MEATLITSIFSNICQVTATIISIYLGVFIFFWNYMLDNKKSSKKMDIRNVNSFLSFLCLMLLVVNYYFVFPSVELGFLTYFPLILILIYLMLLIWQFVKKKDFILIEKGLLVLSTIFALIAFIFGFYLIISCISSLPFVGTLLDNYVYKLIKVSRMFFVLILDSLMFLVSFILIHKFFIFKEK
jgi:hypothetical protein